MIGMASRVNILLSNIGNRSAFDLLGPFFGLFWTIKSFLDIFYLSGLFGTFPPCFDLLGLKVSKLCLEKQVKKVPNGHKSIEKVQKDMIDLFFRDFNCQSFFLDDNTEKSERHKLILFKYCRKILFFNAILQVLQILGI